MQRNALHFEAVEARLHQIRERHGRQIRGLHGCAVVGRIDVMKVHGFLAVLEFNRTADIDTGRAGGALGRIDRRKYRHLQQERGQKAVVHHLHVVIARIGRSLADGDVERKHSSTFAKRSRNGCIAVLRNGAHQFARR